MQWLRRLAARFSRRSSFVYSRDLSDRLRTWVDMVRADAAHPAYTIQLLNEAADIIDLIDRECSLCKPYRTLPAHAGAVTTSLKPVVGQEDLCKP
jgi:hypothetical protein